MVFRIKIINDNFFVKNNDIFRYRGLALEDIGGIAFV